MLRFLCLPTLTDKISGISLTVNAKNNIKFFVIVFLIVKLIAAAKEKHSRPKIKK